ncbi:MAG: STAS domain-containing protein [Marmoricola sp.]
MTFDVSTSTSSAGVPTVAASGDLDVASADQLVEAVNSVLGDQANLDLDLSAVSFMDSTGLGALIRVRNHLADRGGELTLTSVSPAVERVLVLVGMADGFGVEQA